MAREYILDGYNIIKCCDDLADLSLQAGREALLDILRLRRPQGSPRNCVTVVFDGQPDVWGPSLSGEFRCIFTSGETADEYIKRLVESSQDARRVIVVTNDREITAYIRKLGADGWSVQRFLSAGRRAQSRRSETASAGNPEQISSTVQNQITQELEDLWIKKKKR